MHQLSFLFSKCSVGGQPTYLARVSTEALPTRSAKPQANESTGSAEGRCLCAMYGPLPISRVAPLDRLLRYFTTITNQIIQLILINNRLCPGHNFYMTQGHSSTWKKMYSSTNWYYNNDIYVYVYVNWNPYRVENIVAKGEIAH